MIIFLFIILFKQIQLLLIIVIMRESTQKN